MTQIRVPGYLAGGVLPVLAVGGDVGPQSPEEQEEGGSEQAAGGSAQGRAVRRARSREERGGAELSVRRVTYGRV